MWGKGEYPSNLKSWDGQNYVCFLPFLGKNKLSNAPLPLSGPLIRRWVYYIAMAISNTMNELILSNFFNDYLKFGFFTWW